MKLSPINTPRVAQVAGAKTLPAQAAREAAMAAFNAQPPAAQVEAPAALAAAPVGQQGGLTTGQSPSEPGAKLDAAALAATPTSDDAAAPSTEAPNAEAARINAHYANLARKEKMQRMREARINAKLEQIALATAPATPTPSFDPAKYVDRDQLVNDPFGVLNNLGLTYEQLTQKALNAPTPESLEQQRQIAALNAKIAALESAQKKVSETFEETQTQARQQAELQIKQDVSRLLATDPSFEVTRASQGAQNVVRLITAVYDHGMGAEYPKGTILDVYEATQMVEDELRARHQRISQRLNSNNAAPKPQTTQAADTPNALRTLTNAVGTSTRKLSSRERALAAFRGEAV